MMNKLDDCENENLIFSNDHKKMFKNLLTL